MAHHPTAWGHLSQVHSPNLLFRGSLTRLSISRSTLHAAISDDDARLAYSASLLAFLRALSPLGRRCGVSSPAAVPRLSPFDQFVCLCHSVLSGFCFRGFPRHRLGRRWWCPRRCRRCRRCNGREQASGPVRAQRAGCPGSLVERESSFLPQSVPGVQRCCCPLTRR